MKYVITITYNHTMVKEDIGEFRVSFSSNTDGLYVRVADHLKSLGITPEIYHPSESTIIRGRDDWNIFRLTATEISHFEAADLRRNGGEFLFVSILDPEYKED